MNCIKYIFIYLIVNANIIDLYILCDANYQDIHSNKSSFDLFLFRMFFEGLSWATGDKIAFKGKYMYCLST